MYVNTNTCAVSLPLVCRQKCLECFCISRTGYRREKKLKMHSLPEERQKVKRRGAAGVAIAVISTVLGYYFAPFAVPGEDSLTARLVYTLRWQIFPLKTLMFAIGRVADTRMATAAINPMSGKGEHLVEFQQRFLRNTLEQLIVHVLGQLVLCTFLSSESIRIIPPMALLFVAGRILFWIGYRTDPLKRASGFAMNFPTAMVTVIYCAFCMMWHGSAYLIAGQ